MVGILNQFYQEVRQSKLQRSNGRFFFSIFLMVGILKINSIRMKK